MGQAADRVGSTTASLEEKPHLLGNALDFLVRLIIRAGALRFGRKDDAGQRISPAEHISTDLLRPPSQAAHVVEPGSRVEQALVSETVYLNLAFQEGGQLEQESLAVERLPQELPCSCAVGFEPLSSPGGP